MNISTQIMVIICGVFKILKIGNFLDKWAKCGVTLIIFDEIEDPVNLPALQSTYNPHDFF